MEDILNKFVDPDMQESSLHMILHMVDLELHPFTLSIPLRLR